MTSLATRAKEAIDRLQDIGNENWRDIDYLLSDLAHLKSLEFAFKDWNIGIDKNAIKMAEQKLETALERLK